MYFSDSGAIIIIIYAFFDCKTIADIFCLWANFEVKGRVPRPSWEVANFLVTSRRKQYENSRKSTSSLRGRRRRRRRREIEFPRGGSDNAPVLAFVDDVTMRASWVTMHTENFYAIKLLSLYEILTRKKLQLIL